MARRARLDRKDLELLRVVYFAIPSMGEITGGVKGTGIEKRVHRMSRLGLCACDRPGQHPGEWRRWSVTPEGERVVEMVDEDWEFHLPRKHPNYRFCLARLDLVEEEEVGDG